MNIKKVMTPEERQATFRVRKTVFVEEQNVPVEMEIDEFEEDAIHFVCYIDGKAVGASRLRLFSNCGKLERIAVLKTYRGQSIGTELIHRMESEIAVRQIKESKLNAQTHAIDFYKILGYEVVSGEFMDAGIPHVTMSKSLSSQ